MTEIIYRYVRHYDVERYTAIGWKRVENLAPCHHDHWSTILQWAGEGEPKEPEKEQHT